MRIDNRAQLEQLRTRYAAIGGATMAARAAQQTVDTLTAAYFEAVGLLVGKTFGEGDSVDIEWETGEVTLTHTPTIDLGELNGVVTGG
jgi:hypothetical protein